MLLSAKNWGALIVWHQLSRWPEVLIGVVLFHCRLHQVPLIQLIHILIFVLLEFDVELMLLYRLLDIASWVQLGAVPWLWLARPLRSPHAFWLELRGRGALRDQQVLLCLGMWYYIWMLLSRLRHNDDLHFFFFNLSRLVARVTSGRTQPVSLRCLLRIICFDCFCFGPLQRLRIVPAASLGEHTPHLNLT